MIVPLFAIAGVVLVTIPPEQAAGTALMQCVSHASGMSTIDKGSANDLARNGLEYQVDAPARLKSMVSTPYGTGSFARSPSADGDVWAVGYDRGTCIVMVIGTFVEPVEQRLRALFEVRNTWKSEPIEQRDGPSARWTQYGWDTTNLHLTAQMKVQPLPGSPIKGLVMVTIAPEAKKKK